QATLSIASLAYDPTDPARNTLIAGTGLTVNGTVCAAAVLLHRLRRTAKWTSLHPGWRQYLDLVGRGDARRSERSRGCCARQRDVSSHIRNFRISFRQACGGLVSQHRRRRRLHPDLRGGGDRPPEWTSQLARGGSQ